MQSLLSHLNFKITGVTPVQGGDINKAYCIEAEEGKFFLKVNNKAKYPALFEKEANGLKALAATSALTIPEVIDTGAADSLQYLLLEWIDSGNAASNTWMNFGHQLAKMHKRPKHAFGFAEDNYLGTYLQHNTYTSTWKEFYAQYRILPIIKLLRDQRKIHNETVASAENFCKSLDNIFPVEPPALLHGDLWSGNYLIAANGSAALIDPAVYCGHREMDIGMSKLFGGFSELFYNSYNEIYPLEQGWQERLSYSQLYPLLFHAYAFRGNYIGCIKNILEEF